MAKDKKTKAAPAVAFRFKPEDLKALDRGAASRGLTRIGYIRALVREDLARAGIGRTRPSAEQQLTEIREQLDRIERAVRGR